MGEGVTRPSGFPQMNYERGQRAIRPLFRCGQHIHRANLAARSVIKDTTHKRKRPWFGRHEFDFSLRAWSYGEEPSLVIDSFPGHLAAGDDLLSHQPAGRETVVPLVRILIGQLQYHGIPPGNREEIRRELPGDQGHLNYLPATLRPHRKSGGNGQEQEQYRCDQYPTPVH